MGPCSNTVDIPALITAVNHHQPLSFREWQLLAESLLEQVGGLQDTINSAQNNYRAMEAEGQRLRAENDQLRNIAQQEHDNKNLALHALSQYTNVNPTVPQANHHVVAPALPTTATAPQQGNDPATAAKMVRDEVDCAIGDLESTFSREDLSECGKRLWAS